MPKYFLLIAGTHYYPGHGTDDWIGTYETEEEAEAQVKIEETHEYYQSGKNKGKIKETNRTYIIKDDNFGWYDIVDLREWIGVTDG